MKGILIFSAAALILTACGGDRSFPAKSEGTPPPKVLVEKESLEKEEPLPPEVKIKLKRDGKENYSWELSGSDADQILKTNEKLKRQLAEKPH